MELHDRRNKRLLDLINKGRPDFSKISFNSERLADPRDIPKFPNTYARCPVCNSTGPWHWADHDATGISGGGGDEPYVMTIHKNEMSPQVHRGIQVSSKLMSTNPKDIVDELFHKRDRTVPIVGGRFSASKNLAESNFGLAGKGMVGALITTTKPRCEDRIKTSLPYETEEEVRMQPGTRFKVHKLRVYANQDAPDFLKQWNDTADVSHLLRTDQMEA